MKLKKDYKVLLIIGIVYILLLLLFISKFNFNPSATIELSKLQLNQYDGKIPSGIIIHPTVGTDGQCYYMMSLDLTLDKTHVSYSFLQRILYPLLARILSCNIISLLPITFILINLCSILISSYVLLQILKKYNANLNLVYLWAFNVGIMISLTRNLTELLMICFISLMVYYIEKGNHYLAAVFLALAMLTRELTFTVYAAMLLYFLIKKDFKNFAIYAASVIPFAIWEAILIFRFGVIPLAVSSYALTYMPTGILSYFHGAFSSVNHYVVNPVISNQGYSNNTPLGSYKGSSGLGNFSGWLFDYLKNINKIFSPIPVLLFIIIQGVILVMNFLKDKKITTYTLLLLSQIALFFVLQPDLFFDEVDTIGRYALPLFFFSILYFAERGKKYNKLLTALIILSSVLYFVQRFIIPKGGFWIT